MSRSGWPALTSFTICASSGSSRWSATAAIEILENRGDVRIIITDVDMPGTMDGLMLAAAVADRWPPVRIIVVSGHRSVEITDIPDGAVFYSKLYRSSQIIETMNEMLAYGSPTVSSNLNNWSPSETFS